MQTITSPHNDAFRTWLSLTTSKGLTKEKLFLLSGAKLVAEYLAKPHLTLHTEIITTGMQSLTKQDDKVAHVSAELFVQLDVLGTHHNILVLEQPQLTTLDEATLTSYTPHAIEVVLPVGDPGNLGALIRSCEAFGVSRVILTREAAHPFLPKSVKASAGSVMRVPLTLASTLHAFPDHCIALDMHGTLLKDFVWPKDGLLVVGEEGPGLGDARRFKNRIRIPTHGVESLNVVVATSIALSRWAETIQT
jgi:TrmH family RNA methyltransferase